MANLPELIQYDSGVYQIETSDPVLGGPSGVTNAPLKNLVNRTAYLKKHVDDLEAGTTVPPGIATQSWVTDQLEARDWKQSVRAATTANITLSGTQTIDGVSVTTSDRVLVKNQSTASQNGIYVVSASAWTRADDANISANVTAGLTVFVSEGTLQADTIWKLTTNDPIDLGTTSLTFVDITNGYAPLASPSFTGDPLAPTPAQFDADTSIATTAFVQRALGSIRGQLTYSANATLDADDVGMRINTTTASNITLTVPDPTSYPSGATFLIHNTGGGGITTVAPAVANTLNNGGTLGNIDLGAQSYVWLVRTDEGYWLAFGGSAHIGKTAEYAASVASNGYQKLPSGLIVQWGSAVGVTAGAQTTVTFPIAFPNAGLMCVATVAGNVTTATQYAQFNITSATQMKLAINTGTNNVSWVVIGY